MESPEVSSRGHLRLLVFSFFLALLASPSIAGASADHSAATPPAMVRVTGHVLPALSKATIVPSGSKSASDPIAITLVLKHDDQPAFERYLHEIYDPHSKNFHKFLTQRQIADRFGPSRQVYDRMLQYLRANGFALVQGSRNRLTLTMQTTRSKAERLFQLHIQDYRSNDRQFFANDTDPAMPRELAAHVQTVAGLSNLATPRPDDQAIAGGVEGVFCALASLTCVEASESSRNSVYNKCLTALTDMKTNDFGGKVELANLQCVEQGPLAVHASARKSRPGVSPSFSGPFNGSGQTIGLLEFDTFQTSDVSDFLNLIGSAASQIDQLSEVKVNGGATPGPNQAEVLLDIDTVMTIAEGANVVVYDSPFNGRGSFQALFNKMLDDKVTVISNSWAYCEDQTSLADVQGIDTIFQNAAAAGISVFNGSGDSGSTCLDGSANTVSVPADSPDGTAVGGSSLNPGPGFTYQSETWWDGTTDTPPTGQGGFGVSKFFAVPSFQTGLATGGRSVPDVVDNADPARGAVICQASNGGCPSGLIYGGTSYAAPQWAGYVALINQGLGSNLGAVNPLLYANPDAFHDAASMGSDFAHVGLGSPNLDALFLALSGGSVGSTDASTSTVTPYVPIALTSVVSGPPGIYADGSTKGTIVVQLLDANGNSISGKSVALGATDGSPTITPPSAVTDKSGEAAFSLTDSTVETPKLTATDTTDDVVLSTKPTFPFITPLAAAAGIGAFPTTVTADGTHPTTITVTLEDSLSRPSPGKEIQLSQNGNSVISGPTPPVTDSSGKIEFTAYDTDDETVTYSATDVTDGNLAFPETAQVTFSSAPEPGCANGNVVSAPGYLVAPYVTGLVSENFSYAGGDFGGCPGAWGLAFDGSGNLFVGEEFNGNIYKIPSGGGAAGPGNLIGTVGPLLGQLIFDKGNLYAVEGATSNSGLNTGAVLQIDPDTAATISTVAGGLNCPLEMAVDPLSGDLFVDDGCEGGNGSTALLRISNFTTSPTVSTYATLPTQGNYQITFAADGTIYVFCDAGDGEIAEVGGTNTTQPATVKVLSGPVPEGEFIAASGTASGGGAKYLIFGTAIGTLSEAVAALDLTTSTPSTGAVLMNSGLSPAAENATFGPDGCLYIASGNEVLRISNPDGTCGFASSLSAPSIVLTPPTVSPNPAQGTTQTFTTTFHYAGATAGIPVDFDVTGANPQSQEVTANASGQASFTYAGARQGTDSIVASATVSSSPISSNPVSVTWAAGQDTTFLSLNQSPKGGIEGQGVNLIATLVDISQNPVVPVSGESISFSAGGQNCEAETNSSGIATCGITASSTGLETLTATFAGTSQLIASEASDGFNVITLATPTATATRTATPTATPTPVVGKLKISPKTLNFGDVEMGSNKVKDVKITNAGKVKKKKMPLPILIEMENGVASPFSVTQACDDDDLGPKSKGVKAGNCEVGVTFAPTEAIKYTGTLMIIDNLEPSFENSVKLEGTGKAPKK